MANHEIRLLPIAVRVFPDRSDVERDIRSEKSWRLPEGMLVFDTETRVDATQKLTFGSYRFIVAGQCLEERAEVLVTIAQALGRGQELIGQRGGGQGHVQVPGSTSITFIRLRGGRSDSKARMFQMCS